METYSLKAVVQKCVTEIEEDKIRLVLKSKEFIGVPNHDKLT